MYRYIPPKKRSRLRVALGSLYYRQLRRLFWLKHSKHFSKNLKDISQIDKDFPCTVFQDKSPIYRNLSQDDIKLQDGKAANLSIAVKKVNGALLLPGQIFSYWKLIGNPSKRKGYKKGMMLVNGRPVAATGGGLCALSNLIYWTALHTPLSIRERYRHSYDVFPDSNRIRPFGSGATCVYNYRDLMIQNETKDTYVLKAYIKDKTLYAEWKTINPPRERYEVYQKEHWITSEGRGIYLRHNTLYRKTFAIGTDEKKEELISDTKITENHAIMMYEPLLPEGNSNQQEE